MNARCFRYGLFFSTLTLTACGNIDQPSEESTLFPKVGQTETVYLAKRKSNGNDNYQQACLYLAPIFRKSNHCTLLLQNTGMIRAELMDGEVAEFIKLRGSSGIDKVSLGGAVSVGNTIPREDLKEGDLWMLRKRDRNYSVDLVFQVLKATDNSLALKYKIVRLE